MSIINIMNMIYIVYILYKIYEIHKICKIYKAAFTISPQKNPDFIRFLPKSRRFHRAKPIWWHVPAWAKGFSIRYFGIIHDWGRRF